MHLSAAAEQAWPPFVLVTGLLLIGLVAHRDGLFEQTERFLQGLAGPPVVLLGTCLLLVAVVTAVLNLDTAVVFLTPVLVHAARGRGIEEEAFLYGTVYMANASSLYLPGSNLTNLLVLAHQPISGGTFAARMLVIALAANSPPRWDCSCSFAAGCEQPPVNTAARELGCARLGATRRAGCGGPHDRATQPGDSNPRCRTGLGRDRDRPRPAAMAGGVARCRAGRAPQPVLGVCCGGSHCAILERAGATPRRRWTLGHHGDRRAGVDHHQQPSCCCPSLGTLRRAPSRAAPGVECRPQHRGNGLPLSSCGGVPRDRQTRNPHSWRSRAEEFP